MLRPSEWRQCSGCDHHLIDHSVSPYRWLGVCVAAIGHNLYRTLSSYKWLDLGVAAIGVATLGMATTVCIIFIEQSLSSYRWLGVRVAAVGVVIVGVATSLGVALRYSRTGGLVGLTITYALDVSRRFAFLYITESGEEKEKKKPILFKRSCTQA